MNIKKIDVNDIRNLIVVALVVVGLFTFYGVLAASTDHYVEVDQDIWSFLKYVGVMFLGLLIYIGRELVIGIKAIVKNMVDMNIAFTESRGNITEIRNDVSEIKGTLKEHDTRLTKIESNRVN